jgi:hypothetical protein
MEFGVFEVRFSLALQACVEIVLGIGADSC